MKTLGLILSALITVTVSVGLAVPVDTSTLTLQGYIKRASGATIANSACPSPGCAGSITIYDHSGVASAAAIIWQKTYAGSGMTIVNSLWTKTISGTDDTARDLATKVAAAQGSLYATVVITISGQAETFTLPVTTVPTAIYSGTAGAVSPNAIVTASILDANVTTTKIADANVTAAKLINTGAAGSQVIPSQWSIDGSQVTGNISLTGAATFATGTGAVTLNGDTSIATGKNFSQAGTGTFSTGTGTVSLNGAVTAGAAGTGLAVTNNATVGGTFTVGGTMAVTGNTTFGGTVGITGATTVGSLLTNLWTFPAAGASITQAASGSGSFAINTTSNQNIDLSPNGSGVVNIGGTTPKVTTAAGGLTLAALAGQTTTVGESSNVASTTAINAGTTGKISINETANLASNKSIVMGVGNGAIDMSLSSGALTTGSGGFTVTGGTVDLGSGTIGGSGPVSFTGTFVHNSTGATQIAAGTAAQQPGTPAVGMIRWNSTTSSVEYYSGAAWLSLLGQGTSTTSGTIAIGAGAMTGPVNIGGSGSGAINIGGTTTGTSTFGSVTGAATTTIQSGTGGLTLSPPAAGQLNVGTSMTAGTISIGTGAMTGPVNIGGSGSGAINVGGTSTGTTTVGSSTGAATTSITSGTGGLTVEPPALGLLGLGTTITAGTINMGTGAMTGPLNIGGTSSGAINVGGTSTGTTTLGSATGAATTTIKSGTGGLSLTPPVAGQLNVGTTMTAGTISVGTGAMTGPLNIGGTSSGAINVGGTSTGTTTLGSVTGAATTTIKSGTGGLSLTPPVAGQLNVGASITAGTISIGTGAMTGPLNIGGTSSGAINVGGTSTGTTTLGSATGAATTTIKSGTGGLSLTPPVAGQLNVGTTMTAGTISIGTGAMTGPLNIGGTSSGAINVGGTSTGTTTLGSATGAAATTIQAGSTGIKIGSGNTALTGGIVACSLAVGASATTYAVTGCTGVPSGGAGWGCQCTLNGTGATPTVPAGSVKLAQPGYSAAGTATAANVFVTLSAAPGGTTSLQVSCLCVK